MNYEMDRITRRLDQLLQSDPHLAQPVAYYRALTSVLQSGQPLAPNPGRDAAALQASLEAGQPLLSSFVPNFPASPAGVFFRQVCSAIAPFQAGAEQAARALDAGRLDLPALLAMLVTGDPTGVKAAAQSAEVAPLTLRVLLEYTLRPTLRAWSGQLLTAHSLESWLWSTCPVCGSPPILAELYKSRKLRVLRCGICGSGWPFPIIKCVHCANEDPTTQGIMISDDDERTLIQTCKRCHTYLKTVITEETLPHDLLSLEDLATLDLDQGCQEKGYTRNFQSS